MLVSQENRLALMLWKKMSKNKPLSGSEAFENYYAALFPGRWDSLKQALLEPNTAIAYSDSLVKPYFLDGGSIDAALCLPTCTEGRILDMCAAPGGKSLVLASRLDGSATLQSNELSGERRNRLIRVLEEHLESSVRERVSVSSHDAARWSRYEKEAFERILLDAPCSSERHVLSDPNLLSKWTPARIRNLALRQWSLLSGAFLVLKTGGFLVYATCALSPEENDEVVERLIKKYPSAQICNTHPLPADQLYCAHPERTRFGFHVLPDTSDSCGPLYYALITKSASVPQS